MTSRRRFIQTATASTVAVAFAPRFKEIGKKSANPRESADKIQLGMASYSFREFNLDDTIAMTRRLDLNRIAFKSFHLPLDSSMEEIKKVIKKVKAAGLELYGGGVIYMKNEDEVHRAFKYAKTAGMQVIIGVPEHHLLDLVEKKVKDTDIKLAIHNHGPGDKRYPGPKEAYEKIHKMDPRMGLCIDVGHTVRNGVDPADAIIKFADRLHDVHIKDVTEATKAGATLEIGRGIVNIPDVMRALLKIKYKGTVAFEFEKDAKDPLPGTAESLGFVKGVLSVL
ncbi:sugar phosphate isomerase/epimerase family protein [bacterium]